MMTSRVLLLVALVFIAAPLSAADPVEIAVKGLEGDALANVRAALALPYGLVQNNTVNVTWIERFVNQAPENARRALEPFGFYQAEVHARLEKEGENRYRVLVEVQPGEPVRITHVTAAIRGPGADDETLKALLRGFPLRKGDILLQKKYEEAKAALKSRATGAGFLDADFATHLIDIDPARLSARIDLEMETGPQYRFGEVRFEGVRRYPESFIDRYVAFKPGDVFSYAKLGETQLSLINSERFSDVILTPQKDQARDYRVPILVRLKEAPTKRLRPGIGYATDTGPRLTMKYRNLDAFERGQEFHAEFLLSPRIQNIGAGYILPDALDINSFTGIQATLSRENVPTYITEDATIELDRTRSFGRGRLGTGYVKLIQENSTIAGVGTSSRLVMPGVRLSERRFDNLIRPTKAHYYSLDVHGTDEALGSDTRFIQVVAEGHILIPLAGRLSLLARVNAGATFQNASAVGELPVSLRFFAGGDRSVRGYSYQSLGPTDQKGAVIGGRDLFAGSIELDEALFTKWGAAAFYDAGNAFNSFSHVQLAQGAGIGVRYYTAVGAVRLDFARQIAIVHPGYRVHVTIGVEF